MVISTLPFLLELLSLFTSNVCTPSLLEIAPVHTFAAAGRHGLGLPFAVEDRKSLGKHKR